MRNDLVYRSNVVYAFYRAALANEISPEDFRKARGIIDRAKAVPVEEIVEHPELFAENPASEQQMMQKPAHPSLYELESRYGDMLRKGVDV